MRNLFFLFIVLCVGGLVPIQETINAHLRKSLNHLLQTTFISFFGAVVLLTILLFVLGPSLPSMAQLKSIPLYYYTGGIFGVIFITTVLMLAPRIGIAKTLVAPLSNN